MYVAIGGHVEVALVGGPAERGAQVGELGGEPVVGLALAGAVPQGHDVGFTTGEVPGMGGPNLFRFRRTGGDELFFGELADRLQHRKPGPPRIPVGDQQRLTHQGVQQIQHGVVVGAIESAYCTGTLQIEPTREHRTPLQQRLLLVIEVVVGPCHRVAQRVVAFQPAPGPTSSRNR